MHVNTYTHTHRETHKLRKIRGKVKHIQVPSLDLRASFVGLMLFSLYQIPLVECDWALEPHSAHQIFIDFIIITRNGKTNKQNKNNMSCINGLIAEINWQNLTFSCDKLDFLLKLIASNWICCLCFRDDPLLRSDPSPHTDDIMILLQVDPFVVFLWSSSKVLQPHVYITYFLNWL